jgi:flagellar biosynthesis protein FlhF
MQIKKFKANNMKEALKMVKHEFGPEAVILSAKNIENDKKIFNFSRSQGVIITAAMDIQSLEKEKNNAHYMTSKYYGPNILQSGSHGLKKKYNFIDSLRQGAINYGKKSRSPEKTNRLSNRGTKELFKSYHQMLDQDVDKNIALDLVREVNKYTFPERYLYKRGIKQCMIQVLEDIGVSARRVKLKKGNRQIVALIGPTGVGKTSTIAKLAAAAMTRDKKQRVALITIDEDRIGAIEQLKLYSKILGIPVRSASNKKELKKSIEKFSNFNLIFIDTPGMAKKNRRQIGEIQGTLDSKIDIEYHLVLSAATNDKTLKDILEKYKNVNISRLLFTKLDECITFGSILNQLYRTKIPVSYFTDGTKIPEDIEAATIEKLTSMIFIEKNMQKYVTGSPEELAQNIMRFEKTLYGLEENIPSIGLNNTKQYAPGAYGL